MYPNMVVACRLAGDMDTRGEALQSQLPCPTCLAAAGQMLAAAGPAAPALLLLQRK